MRILSFLFAITISKFALALTVGQPAPIFSLTDQSGQTFSLKENAGKKWTVLYFYPKAGTPGCTAQACAFRDSIKKIESENATVYGVSTDSVADLKSFHDKHHLQFRLLSDADGKICSEYGTKMPLVTYSKRITFIIDDNLVVRSIDADVDPALDATRVADTIRALKKQSVKELPAPKT